MVALNKLNLSLPSIAPGDIPDELYLAINDVYLQFAALLQKIDAAQPVMQSPNGRYWVATISNTGVITWTDVGTVRP